MIPEEEEQEQEVEGQPDPADQDTLVFDPKNPKKNRSTPLLTPLQMTQPLQWVNQL